MSKTKINVALGALTGVLVGFVFGVAFGNPSGGLDSDGAKAKGDIAHISQIRKALITPSDEPPVNREESDTLALRAMDENGKEMQIIIVKEQ